MSSRFLCADLNNIFYAHGGVQNPCYRSIVSNTETFEILPTIRATTLSTTTTSKYPAKNMQMSPAKWMKKVTECLKTQTPMGVFTPTGAR